jgi:hypothetical protein
LATIRSISSGDAWRRRWVIPLNLGGWLILAIGGGWLAWTLLS